MYNFLISEVWWMETIIAASISASVTLLVAFVAYNYKLKKATETIDLLPKEHNELSSEHSKLSDEHQILSTKINEHKALSDLNQVALLAKHNSIEKTNDKILNVVDKLNERSIAEEVKLSKLSKSQTDINDAINIIVNVNHEIMNLQSKILEYKNTISMLENKNNRLEDDMSEKISQLNSNISKFRNANNNLKSENERLQKIIDDYNRPSRPQGYDIEF